MPIISTNNNHEAKLQSHVDNLRTQISRLYVQMKTNYTMLFNNVWKNREFTPEEILEKFGTDATELFMLSAALRDLLNGVVPNSVNGQPPLPVTFNLDGSVTVNRPSSSSSVSGSSSSLEPELSSSSSSVPPASSSSSSTEA